MSDDKYRINIHSLTNATKRLIRELNIIDKDPIPGIDLRANEDNILEWHFVIHGKEDTPYSGGMYHGKLIFPSNFPFGPPKIILFLTPNARFKTNEGICFDLSDFHPEEWKPEYSVSTVLQRVLDFRHDSTESIGSIETGERSSDATNSQRKFHSSYKEKMSRQITSPEKVISPDVENIPKQVHSFEEYITVPSPSIRYRGAAHSHKNLPSSPKEIISQVKTVHPSGITHFQRLSDEEKMNSFYQRQATKRLNRELTIIAEDPIPGIDIRASKDNILEWHFVIHGKRILLTMVECPSRKTHISFKLPFQSS